MTALELIRNKFPDHNDVFVLRNIEEFMVEFAKIHVEAALKAAGEKHIPSLYTKGLYKGAKWIELKERDTYNSLEKSIRTKTNKKSILKSYPLSNIK